MGKGHVFSSCPPLRRLVKYSTHLISFKRIFFPYSRIFRVSAGMTGRILAVDISPRLATDKSIRMSRSRNCRPDRKHDNTPRIYASVVTGARLDFADRLRDILLLFPRSFRCGQRHFRRYFESAPACSVSLLLRRERVSGTAFGAAETVHAVGIAEDAVFCRLGREEAEGT